MYHMDFYRLQNVDEVIDLGFEEYFYLSGLTVIEWAKRAKELLPEVRLSLELLRDEDDRRTIILQAADIFQKRVQDILGTFEIS